MNQLESRMITCSESPDPKGSDAWSWEGDNNKGVDIECERVLVVNADIGERLPAIFKAVLVSEASNMVATVLKFFLLI